MNLREYLTYQLRKMGIAVKDGMSKDMLERLYNKNKEDAGTTANFPYPVEPFNSRKLQDGCVWLVDMDENRKAGTFNLINILDKPKKGKGSIYNISPEFWAWLCELNRYNIAKENWWKLLVNTSNAEYFLSGRTDKKGIVYQLYIPANGCFGRNQVRIKEKVKGFVRIDAINPNDLPPITDELRQDKARIHVYNSGKGWHPNYPILWPVLAPYGEAWIESRLLKGE